MMFVCLFGVNHRNYPKRARTLPIPICLTTKNRVFISLLNAVGARSLSVAFT